MKIHWELWVLLVGILMTGCRKELCYDHPDHAPGVYLDIKAQWEQVWERDYGCDWKNHWGSEWGTIYEDLCPSIPEGLRLRAYRNDDVSREYNLPSEGDLVTLDGEGVYSLLYHNNDTEYIVYEDMAVSTRATATTRTVSRSGFRSLHEGERTINPPDMLYGKYIEEYVAERRIGAELLDITMRPLVYTYYIRFEFAKGLEHVVKACGAIAGMAEKVYLYDGHTGKEAATILYSCQLGESGVEAEVMTFGVPNYPDDHYNQRDLGKQPFMLSLEVLLKNGSTLTFDFDIAEQMKGQPRGGVIVINNIDLIAGTESGFGVGVDEWGEIEIPVLLN